MHSAFSANIFEPILAGETGRNGAEHLVQIIERPVHRVHREIAGEHAAIHAEHLDRVLEPGGEGVDVDGLQRHGQTRKLADNIVAHSGQRVDAVPPEGPLLVGARAGPSGVLHDHAEIGKSLELIRRHAELVRMGHQLEHQVPFLQCLEHSTIREWTFVATHRAHAAKA